MRVTRIENINGRSSDHFGSERFTVTPLARSAHNIIATLGPGGRIGPHPAVVDQLLVVVTGDAIVSGSDGNPVDVGPGDLVYWSAGENHETRSNGGLTALILETDELRDATNLIAPA